MPLFPLYIATNAIICRRQSCLPATLSLIFGLSNPVTNILAFPLNKRATISLRVTLSAVAVKAAIGMLGNNVFKRVRSSYSGLNAGPH